MSAASTGELQFIEGTMNVNMYCDIQFFSQRSESEILIVVQILISVQQRECAVYRTSIVHKKLKSLYLMFYSRKQVHNHLITRQKKR